MPKKPVPVRFRGVNLSGAEFGTLLPGIEGTDYTWPTTNEIDYFISKGMNTFRVNFVWERLQPTANGPLATTYAAKLEALVNYITSKGASALLNPQNFARYYGKSIGSTDVPNSVFANFWSKIANTYKANSRVMFGLVNEPYGLPVMQWVDAANAAIVGIRATGATNIITVPNINYTGAWTWTDDGNGDAMLKITDSGNNFVYEAHQYLDSDGSGRHPTCVSSTVGKDRIVKFVDWLRDNNKKGLFGEFAAANNPTCEAAIKGMLQYMTDNADVVVGWLWWSAGPWWPADYILSLEKRPDGTDAPQMAWLTPYL